MASDAFTKLEEKMSAAREAELAAYIMRDVELRQANAQGKQQCLLAVLSKGSIIDTFLWSQKAVFLPMAKGQCLVVDQTKDSCRTL